MEDGSKQTVPFSVSGKTAIITGAGSGICLAFAELLLSRNCNVVFADLALRPEAQQLLSNYENPGASPRAIFVKTDVTSWPELRRMFTAAVQQFASFDIVCPGAGVYEPAWSSFWHPPGSDASNDDKDGGRYTTLDINLTHPIRATQMAISYWLHPGHHASSELEYKKASLANPKRVIHVASVASQIPVFRAPLYGATKFAISGFVRCLAQLEDWGIRVNAVAPGLVRTPLWTENPDKLGNIDQSRDAWVTPMEVAEAMLACLEGDDKVGGTVIEVGAGRTREVGIFNDPGPDPAPEAGFISSNGEFGLEAVRQLLDESDTWGLRTR